ncbi:hypothetical protein Pelo_19718 [Pelomyxa schiedti]|nr:hypothetical protein Pelo_19718 [Pelomyxa schiedti]
MFLVSQQHQEPPELPAHFRNHHQDPKKIALSGRKEGRGYGEKQQENSMTLLADICAHCTFAMALATSKVVWWH